ncbi:uncharacterized protein LOC144321961 [Canis aureus]
MSMVAQVMVYNKAGTETHHLLPSSLKPSENVWKRTSFTATQWAFFSFLSAITWLSKPGKPASQLCPGDKAWPELLLPSEGLSLTAFSSLQLSKRNTIGHHFDLWTNWRLTKISTLCILCLCD